MKNPFDPSGPRLVVAWLTWVSLAVLSALAGPATAVPLRDVPVELVQPWGEHVQALATGDEHRRRIYDAGGHTLIHDAETGAWVYAQLDAGRLVPTAFVPGLVDPVVVGLPAGLDLSPEQARAARAPWPRSLVRPPVTAPTTGAFNNLVISVRFADESEAGETFSSYDSLFNTAAASLRSYYTEVSYGKLAVVTRFLPAPVGGLMVSYQDAHPRGYYQPISAFTNPDGYVTQADRYDREQALVYHATLAVQAAVPADLDLDGDNDGVVDNVTYVVSGAADGWSDLLWSHMWELYQYDVTLGGAAVVTFDLVMRDQLDLFTLAHEMFHSLGAPDLYHYSQDGRSTVAGWDLMEAGRGHMSAWMKHRYGGWLDLPVLGPGTHTLSPLTASSGCAGLVTLPTSASQRLVVEYRRKTGTFEGNLPGTGLVIYRVDPTLNGNADGPPDELYAFRVGGTASTEGLWWESTFTSDVLRPAFGPGTDPAPFLADGTPVPIRIDAIGPAGATITFTVKDCAAACVGHACGDNGCGGTCGTCGPSQICQGGLCVADCTPSCGGRSCGGDGCGGSCGSCDDADACTADTCDGAGLCHHVAPSCDDGNACTDDGCSPATGLCGHTPVTPGARCDDGNACTQVDACDGGVCVGAFPVACPAPDACHLPGQCNPITGTCSQPTMPDGLPCDDGNACTQLDACLGGACAGSAPVTCRAPGACELSVACDPDTGACEVTPAPFGLPCDDGNACTGLSYCSSGACVGEQRVVCPAVDACHVALGCDPATGACQVGPAPDDSACDDGSACTRVDRCHDGACVGADPVVCAAASPCHPQGSCDSATGACSTPVDGDGTACAADAFACTADVCQSGACSHPVLDGCLIDDACVAADEANPMSACEACVPGASRVAWSPRPDETPCADDQFCTVDDACVAGVCVSGAPRACPAPADACHVAACDETADACTTPALDDGTPCDDGDLCTRLDACAAGACLGFDVVVCPAPAPCHDAGVCLPATGLCTFAPHADGTPCDDGAFCTLDDACQAGACAAGDPRDCSAASDACLEGACDEAADACVSVPLAQGSPCGNPLRCEGGVLEPGDACDDAGACIDAGAIPCAPYAGCASIGACATSCVTTAECVAGRDCLGSACVVNQAPVAAVASGQAVGEGVFLTLDGSGSYDPEGQPLTFAWAQVAGPTRALDDPTAATPGFTTPAVVAPVLLSYQLVVSDGLLQSAPKVTIVSIANTVNELPIAVVDVAEPTELDEGTQFLLSGAHSYDVNGDTLTWFWDQTEGPAIEITEPTAPDLVAVAPQVDADVMLTFRLVVNDGQASSPPAFGTILVRDLPAPDAVEPPDALDEAAPEVVAEIAPEIAPEVSDDAAPPDDAAPTDVPPDPSEVEGADVPLPDGSPPDVAPDGSDPDVGPEADSAAPDGLVAPDRATSDVPPDPSTVEGADVSSADLVNAEPFETDLTDRRGSGCAISGVAGPSRATSALGLALLALAAWVVIRRRFC